MNNVLITTIASIITLIIGLLVGFLMRKNISEKHIGSAEIHAAKIIEDANKEADSTKKAMLVEAKDEIFKLRTEQENENRERRLEIQKSEKRILQKEENLERKSDILEKKNAKLDTEMKNIEIKQKEIQEIVDKQLQELERVANLTQDEAKNVLLNDLREQVTHEQAMIIKELEAKTKDKADSYAREIITTSIQRYAADYVAESTVSVVSLPNDEMKGRIIGREGRNIRAFETLTGVDLIIDDTPEAVVLSAFNPVRREIARIALEKLILDGRIHPTRIEEMVEKATKEVDATIKINGENACDETNVHGIHPEIVKLLGKLHYRTSYGQNVLKHSIEVSNIAGMMAAEIGADVKLAKRGGLLHDIGKAIDHEIEGPHVELGVQAAKRFKEKPEVINCIESHHGDVEPTTIEAVLVQAADAISAARPGARREAIENYIQRLESLEEISSSFKGVDKSYAIQAGRELRIMVKPEEISEDEMIILARDISARIEDELEYPGQIKVNVIRESRVTDYAK
ncbi:ribonuclease Y [Miniphocaeibacter halophilus]|uniref:Ribonuclease Y n=1 Tax=Miniphocaeibacter halophilus TaxID=2931922 RepID=A0AC61MPX3_9FIRM|nr:ribonuclease Y [Miniphocaeibacter halophilus]QQK07615.1 ribonuclease Y [Miniphocaeibacter halophilus]